LYHPRIVVMTQCLVTEKFCDQSLSSVIIPVAISRCESGFCALFVTDL